MSPLLYRFNTWEKMDEFKKFLPGSGEGSVMDG
jgi:hypothetical protein